MKKLILLVALLVAAPCFVFAQGSAAVGNPVAVNQSGAPLPSTLVTICATNPGIFSCGSLVPTFTDITITHACTGTLQALNNSANPTIGAGCSNPGYTDGLGNVNVYAAAGPYYCQYSAPSIVSYTQLCIFPGGSGGGGGSTSPGAPFFSIQYNGSGFFAGNTNWVYSPPPAGSNGLGSVVDGGDMAIGANLNVGGNLTMTGSGGTQWNGNLLGSTTLTPLPPFAFALGVGSDAFFRCMTASATNCLNLSTIGGSLSIGQIPDLSNGQGGEPYISQTQLGIANGVATLDGGGKLPSSEYQTYLPLLLNNDPISGTTVNLLATTTSIGNAVTISTSSFYGILGPVQGGAGVSGTVTIAADGVGLCMFDGATNAGDVVVPSTTVAGNCHDSGSTASSPWLTQVGIVQQAITVAGTAKMQVNILAPAAVSTSYPNDTTSGTFLYSLAKLTGSGVSGVQVGAARTASTAAWGGVALELKPSGSTAPTYVNGVICNTTTAATSLPCTYAPTSGHAVVLAVTWSGTPGSAGACSDSGSNAVAGSGTVTTNGGVSQELFAYIPGAGITSFTCTWTTPRQAGIAVAEYAGASSSINFAPTGNTGGCSISCFFGGVSINPLYTVTQDRMVASFSEVVSNTWGPNIGNLDETGGTANANFAIVSASSGSGAPNSAKILATTDLRAAGVAINGVGTSGTATLCNLGVCPCAFDATSVTINDFVQISSTTAGDCHDVGSTRPTSGQILGQVLASGSGSAVYNVFFFGPDDQGVTGGGGGSGTVSSNTLYTGCPAYYPSTGTPTTVSCANTNVNGVTLGSPATSPAILIDQTSGTAHIGAFTGSESLVISQQQPTTDLFQIWSCSAASCTPTKKVWIDLNGNLNVLSSISIYTSAIQGGNAGSAIAISGGIDSNANQGGVTVRGGNVTGTGAFTAGSVTIQPGALTNASPGGSAVEGTIAYMGGVYIKTGTATVGDLACFTANNTISNCASTTTNGQFIGIIAVNTGGSYYVQTGGTVAVTLDTTYTYAVNDFVCVSTTTGGLAKMATTGVNPCSGYNTHVGFATTSGSAVSTVTVLLSK